MLVGLGGDLVDEVADREHVVAAAGAVVGGDEGAGDREELVLGEPGAVLGALLGLGFLVGRQGFLQGRLSDKGGGFPNGTTACRLRYKDSTNGRDAHTRHPCERQFGW